ncbi:MAG: hypothetical protein QOJ59_3194 [Thermomicrobiales bacterium]|nr:hypothetical protein [Thermomicrobiales bacterium]
MDGGAVRDATAGGGGECEQEGIDREHDEGGQNLERAGYEGYDGRQKCDAEEETEEGFPDRYVCHGVAPVGAHADRLDGVILETTPGPRQGVD